MSAHETPSSRETILWRRLDCPGHDACRLEATRDGFRLEGATAFRREGVPALLAYRLTCDVDWRTRKGAPAAGSDGKRSSGAPSARPRGFGR
jgi:hypothetical protein